jgi:hypothetical protein
VISAELTPHLKRGSAYDDATALALAEHAAAIYLAPDAYAEACLRAGFSGALTATSGATQVGIAWATWGIVVCARGSSERLDWVENLQAWRVSWRELLPAGAGVHRGFKRQAERLRRVIRSRVEAVLGHAADGAPVWYAGHSLGAALAPLVALCLRRDLALQPAAFYLFASPRLGNRGLSEWWAAEFGAITHRVVIAHRGVTDLVTRIPPAAWGWWHLGRPQIIRDSRRYESEAEWERLRAEHPERPMAQWRVLSRLLLGVQGHLAGQLVADLRQVLALRRPTAASPLDLATAKV